MDETKICYTREEIKEMPFYSRWMYSKIPCCLCGKYTNKYAFRYVLSNYSITCDGRRCQPEAHFLYDSPESSSEEYVNIESPKPRRTKTIPCEKPRIEKSQTSSWPTSNLTFESRSFVETPVLAVSPLRILRRRNSTGSLMCSEIAHQKNLNVSHGETPEGGGWQRD